MTIRDIDVVVAGLGPSGAAALARLGRSGASAIGIEARSATPDRVNVVFLHAGTRRIMQGLERGSWSPDDLFTLPGASSIRDVERRLRTSAAAAGAEALYDTPIRSIEQLRDGRFLTRVEGSRDAFRSTWLIDSSGGRAPGLEALAPRLQTTSRARDTYVISHSAWHPGLPVRSKQVVDPDGVARYVNLARYRPDAELGTQLTIQMRGAAPADPEAFEAFMRPAAGLRDPRADAVSVVTITPQAAGGARRGNLLLTGDGITRIHPGTAQGINLGVHDGDRAARAIVRARAARTPEEAERALAQYDEFTMADHEAAEAASDLHFL